MKIRIDDKVKIEEAVKVAEHGCRSRLLDIDDIEYAVQKAEQQLQALRIPQKSWKDCIIELFPEKVANSYRGIPEGTFAEVKRFSSGWFVTRIFRQRTGSQSRGGNKREFLILSELAKSHIPNSFEI